jgi:hypothetical protein
MPAVNVFVVARYPRGLPVPAELELVGELPWADGPLGFAVDWCDRRGNVLFHFNPRPDEGRVALNSRLRGVWGEEESLASWPFSVERDTLVRLRFEVSREGFAVFADGRPLGTFRHRSRPRRLREVRSQTAMLWRRQPSGGYAAPENVQRADIDFDWIAEARVRRLRPRRRGAARVFAVLGAWMEEDVVGATVANCFRQGCERVYLVDNDSADRTVDRAVAAGAVHARSFSTQVFDERERMRQMQAVMEEVSAAEADERVWWLFLDADEFYMGPRGLTVREHLASLDRRFRIVGARVFNHLPDGEPAYVTGRHPLDFQPCCYTLPQVSYCGSGHWKHPLVRWERAGPSIEVGHSFHIARSAEPLLEPPHPVLCLHFPYRDEQTTRRRLGRLFGVAGTSDRTVPDDDTVVHMRLRLRSLDAIYAGRYDQALFQFYPRGLVPELRPLEGWVGRSEADVPRWY